MLPLLGWVYLRQNAGVAPSQLYGPHLGHTNDAITGAELGVKQRVPINVGGFSTARVVNPNYPTYAYGQDIKDGRSFIMRFSHNGSDLLITTNELRLGLGQAGPGTSGGHVPSTISGSDSTGGTTTTVERVVVVLAGVVEPHPGIDVGGGGHVADNVLSMNITPALSQSRKILQVLLAPTSASSSGAVISAAVAATKVVGGTTSDNVTSEEINSFYFYEQINRIENRDCVQE
ncbi:hypothetical protein pipiens_017790 [Culex pipiens pipiens]|uniref:Uncharacterized protein n=1 Tax=Culex pipiens pipiens TaxID=38569 RepID=A0ABD1CEY6_CULPP